MHIPAIPDNELKPQLEILVYIAEKASIELNFEFYPPVTEDDIKECESSLKITFPQGYKDFLRFSNGAKLCGFTADFDDIESVVNNSNMEMAEDFPKDYVIVADIMGDGEVLCFSKRTGKFIRYFDGEETVYDDFYAFFEWLIGFIKDIAEDYVDF